MRLRTTALVASALAGFLYVTMPSASALPTASRADITTAKIAGVTEEVGYRRRGWRGYGYGYRPYGYGYGYGYRPYYRPYYYRPYYGGWGYPYYYRRRPGFGLYFGF
jgi:hypothetical protein